MARRGGGVAASAAALTLVAAVLVPAAKTFGVVGLAAAKPPAKATAPAVAAAFPANGGVYNAAAWGGRCSGATGACGTASDANGVTRVYVSVQQSATGRYWNGSSFSAPSAVLLIATGTTSWRLALPMPADGSYRVAARAFSKLGASSAVTTIAQFAVDNTKPPQPVLTAGAPIATTDTNAEFSFRSNTAGVTFACSLDGATASACSSPAKYKNLATGAHTFKVWAFDAARNASTPATDTWAVTKPASFGITGSVAGLAPGITQPVDLSLTNPNDVPISVTSVTIAIGATTTRDGHSNPDCIGRDNLVMVHGLVGTVTVPANTTATLTQLSVDPSRWPALQMPDRPVNQDACMNTSFALTYTGNASQT